jgi:hypothetical protein
MNPHAKEAGLFREMPEQGAKQHGRFVLVRQSLTKPKENSEDSKKAEAPISEESAEELSLGRKVRFELYDVIDNKLIWSRDFPKEAPKYFVDEFSGRLIFYWKLGSDVGKSKLQENPTLAKRAKDLANKNDDFLIEVVDAFAARTVGSLLVDTGEGSFEVDAGFSEGDTLVLRDSENRILVFSINAGTLQHRFFGAEVSLNPARTQIVVENYPGELTSYDLTSGESLAKLIFKRDTVLTRFSLDGKRLFVLSDEQVGYAFDMEKVSSGR